MMGVYLVARYFSGKGNPFGKAIATTPIAIIVWPVLIFFLGGMAICYPFGILGDKIEEYARNKKPNDFHNKRPTWKETNK
jgi:hypothetical protein